MVDYEKEIDKAQLVYEWDTYMLGRQKPAIRESEFVEQEFLKLYGQLAFKKNFVNL